MLATLNATLTKVPKQEATVADLENKRFTAPAQPSTRRKLSTAKSRNSRHQSKKRKKQTRLPPSLRYVETKRGKTTVRRYQDRSVHYLEEVQGKLVDHVEIHDSGDNHGISVFFRTKPPSAFLLSQGLPCSPNMLIGRPATGVLSSAGLLCTARDFERSEPIPPFAAQREARRK